MIFLMYENWLSDFLHDNDHTWGYPYARGWAKEYTCILGGLPKNSGYRLVIHDRTKRALFNYSNCKNFWWFRTFKLFERQWSQRGLPLRPIQSDWRAMYTLGFGMRIVSCPSSMGSAVESESSRCLEDDMFEDDMYKYVREEARRD